MILIQVSTTVKELEDKNAKLIEKIDEICKLEMHLKEQVGSYLSSLWAVIVSLQWWIFLWLLIVLYLE